MIVWNRWGFLVPVISFGSLLLAEYASETWTGDDQYFQKHGWPMSVAFTAAALIIAGLSPWIHQREQRVLVDPQTGDEVRVGERSSFLFIPLKFWIPLLLLAALAALCR